MPWTELKLGLEPGLPPLKRGMLKKLEGDAVLAKGLEINVKVVSKHKSNGTPVKQDLEGVAPVGSPPLAINLAKLVAEHAT